MHALDVLGAERRVFRLRGPINPPRLQLTQKARHSVACFSRALPTAYGPLHVGKQREKVRVAAQTCVDLRLCGCGVAQNVALSFRELEVGVDGRDLVVEERTGVSVDRDEDPDAAFLDKKSFIGVAAHGRIGNFGESTVNSQRLANTYDCGSGLRLSNLSIALSDGIEDNKLTLAHNVRQRPIDRQNQEALEV